MRDPLFPFGFLLLLIYTYEESIIGAFCRPKEVLKQPDLQLAWTRLVVWICAVVNGRKFIPGDKQTFKICKIAGTLDSAHTKVHTFPATMRSFQLYKNRRRTHKLFHSQNRCRQEDSARLSLGTLSVCACKTNVCFCAVRRKTVNRFLYSGCDSNDVEAKVDDEGDYFTNFARKYNSGSPGFRVREKFIVCDHEHSVMMKGNRKWSMA